MIVAPTPGPSLVAFVYTTHVIWEKYNKIRSCLIKILRLKKHKNI